MSVATIVGVPRVRPVVELGIGQSWNDGGTGGVWDETLWDEEISTWVGIYPSFVDVTCDVLDVSTFCGRDRNTDLWDVATATVTLRNTTGWADYPALPTSPGFLDVRPGIAARIGVAVDGDVDATAILFYGFIDATTPGFVAGEGEVVICDCIDAKGEVGRVELGELAAAVGASETTTARIGRILTAAGWRTEFRTLDTVTVPLVATVLGEATADLLNRAAQSAGADVYGGLDGDVVLRAADWQFYDFDAPVDGVIGPYTTPDYVGLEHDPEGSYLIDPAPVTYVEDPAGSGLWMLFGTTYQLLEGPHRGLWAPATVGPPVVCPSVWELSNAREDFTTRVLVARSDQVPPLQFDDVEGQALYGIETFELTDLETVNDADLSTIGNRLLETRGVAVAPRIAAVTIDAATADNTVDVIAFADPRVPSRYQCRHVTVIGGELVERFNRTMFATSVEHQIAPDNWTCRIGLDDATPWMLGAETGRWDEGAWDESTWAQSWEG